jgi:hypothetical protein
MRVIIAILVIGATVGLPLALGAQLPRTADSEPTDAQFALSVEPGADRIALTHRTGDTLSVDAVDLTVRIDGTPLAQQPPIPFFAADGFESGPTGPLNSNSSNDWAPGETGSIRLAETNTPQLSSGSRVSVTIAYEGTILWEGAVTPC